MEIPICGSVWNVNRNSIIETHIKDFVRVLFNFNQWFKGVLRMEGAATPSISVIYKSCDPEDWTSTSLCPPPPPPHYNPQYSCSVIHEVICKQLHDRKLHVYVLKVRVRTMSRAIFSSILSRIYGTIKSLLEGRDEGSIGEDELEEVNSLHTYM